jgi:hypothetical protein
MFLQNVASQKTAFFIVIAMKVSNLAILSYFEGQ